MPRYFLLAFVLISGWASAQCPMPDNTPAGTLDTCWNQGGSEFNSSVFTLAVQGDGKILAGGIFTAYNEENQAYLARLNMDGSLDTSFRPKISRYPIASCNINSIAIQADGRIVVGGDFDSVNGRECRGIARFFPDGRLDASYTRGYGFPFGIRNMALQPDGKLLVSGHLVYYNWIPVSQIARLNADGSLDTEFSDSIRFYSIDRFGLQPNGKMIAAGLYSETDTTLPYRIFRLNSNGTIDASFSPNIGLRIVHVNSMVLMPGEKTLIKTSLELPTGYYRDSTILLNPDGSIDRSVSVPWVFSRRVKNIIKLSNGEVVGGGTFSSASVTAPYRFVRLRQNGSVDSSYWAGRYFSGSFLPYAHNILEHPNGRWFAIGGFKSYQNHSVGNIACLFHDRSASSSTEQDPILSLSLHPNPAASTVSLNTQESIAQITLISTDGKAIPVQLNQNTFSVAGMRSGIYTVVTRTKTGKVERARLAVSK